MMNLKRKILSIVGVSVIVLIMISLLFFIRVTLINPGHIGIKINMFGAPRGASEIPLKTGWQFYNPIVSQVFEYPVYMQTATWDEKRNESISWNTADQVSIGADINLSYTLEEKLVPAFYFKFRSDDIEKFTHGYLRNVARDAFTAIGVTYCFDEINGIKQDEFLQKVKERINKDTNKYGVSIEQFGIIGRMHMPNAIRDSITYKTQAIQRSIQSENELRTAKAEAAKSVAQAEGEARSKVIRAESESRSNEIVSKSLTHNLILWEAVKKWDGKRP